MFQKIPFTIVVSRLCNKEQTTSFCPNIAKLDAAVVLFCFCFFCHHNTDFTFSFKIRLKNHVNISL